MYQIDCHISFSFSYQKLHSYMLLLFLELVHNVIMHIQMIGMMVHKYFLLKICFYNIICYYHIITSFYHYTIFSGENQVFYFLLFTIFIKLFILKYCIFYFYLYIINLGGDYYDKQRVIIC